MLLDTHAWVWWASDPDRLSPTARDRIEEARGREGLLVSSISVWEVALLVEKGRLELTLDLDDWTAAPRRFPSSGSFRWTTGWPCAPSR